MTQGLSICLFSNVKYRCNWITIASIPLCKITINISVPLSRSRRRLGHFLWGLPLFPDENYKLLHKNKSHRGSCRSPVQTPHPRHLKWQFFSSWYNRTHGHTAEGVFAWVPFAEAGMRENLPALPLQQLPLAALSGGSHGSPSPSSGPSPSLTHPSPVGIIQSISCIISITKKHYCN